jgi:Tol biopolymer transport system component
MAFLRANFPAPTESSLLIANADGTGERLLAMRQRPEAFVPIFFAGASWSSDGKFIATAVAAPRGLGVAESYVAAIRVADGQMEDLTPSRPFPFIGRVQWLPDMSGLLVVAGFGPGNSQIWHLPYPSGEARQITNDLNQHRALSLTADGSRLLNVEASGLVNVWVAPDGDAKRATQLPVGNLGFYSSFGNTVAWTPDGRIVLSNSEGNNIVDIWVMDADGGNRKQLTSNAGLNVGAVASRDGRYIVFSSTRTGTPAIWRMDMDGSNLRKLTSGDGDSFPAISGDSKWVVYTSLTTNKPTIWKVPIDGGEPVALTQSVATNATVSPDGKFVAYLYPDSADPFAPANRMAIISIDGGEPVKTFGVQGVGTIRMIAQWSADGKSIYYTTNNNNVTNVWSQPIDGGPPKQATDFKDSLMTGFAWSLDGKQLACSRGILLRDAVLISDSR